METSKENELSATSSELIVLKNYLAIAKFKSLAMNETTPELSVYQLKIFYEMIASIKKNDKEFQTFSLSYKDFFNNVDIKHGDRHNLLKKAVKKLVSFVLEFKNEKGNTIICSLISKAEFKKNSVDLMFHSDLAPHILSIAESHFFKFYIHNLRRLKSVNAIKLYVLLKSWEGNKGVKYDLTKLRSDLELNGKGYDNFYNLEKKVLKPAIAEINIKTDVKASYKTKKSPANSKRGKVVALHFFIKKKASEQTTENIDKQVPTLFENIQNNEINATKNGSEKDGERSVLVSEILKKVGVYEITQATVETWVEKYPLKQITVGVNYVIARVKKGEKIKNVAGYLNKIVALPDLLTRLEEAETQKKKESEKQAKIAEIDKLKKEIAVQYYQEKDNLTANLLRSEKGLVEQMMQRIQAEKSNQDKTAFASVVVDIFLDFEAVGKDFEEFFWFNYNKGSSFKVFVMVEIEKIYPAEYEKVRAKYAPQAAKLNLRIS